jgi:hypothetical protein
MYVILGLWVWCNCTSSSLDIIVSCEIVSGCVIFVMKNLTQTEQSHCSALFRPQTFIIGDTNLINVT